MIRDATLADIPRLVEMGTRFLTETVYAGRVLINPVAMTRTFTLLIASDVGALFVADDEGQVTGMIGLLIFEHPLTGELAAQELFWWTTPEHRGHGLALLKHAEQWAREGGAAQLAMIAPAGSRIGTLYRRRGYEELEVSWQLDFARVATKAVA